MKLTLTFDQYDELITRLEKRVALSLKRGVYNAKCPDISIIGQPMLSTSALPSLVFYDAVFEPSPKEVEKFVKVRQMIHGYLMEHLELVDADELEDVNIVLVKESEYLKMLSAGKKIFDGIRDRMMSKGSRIFHTMDDYPSVSDLSAHHVEDPDVLRRLIKYQGFYAEVYEPLGNEPGFNKTKQYLKELLEQKVRIVPDGAIKMPKTLIYGD